MRDPYKILGVEKAATQEELKSAYRKQASLHHPDKNPGDETAHVRFKEVNAAYQILSDPQKRAAFDRFGHRGVEAAGGGAGGGNPFGFDISELNLDGLFGDLLGALGIKTGDKGTIKKDLKITFEEAVFGCTKEMTYDRAEPCTDCAGSGAAPGTTPERCSVCEGKGKVRFQQGVLPIAIERPCSRCHGTGRIVTNPCATCRGAGLIAKPRTVEVTIPPGTDNNATRSVDKGGNSPKPDKPPGDLEITVRVQPHEFFRRSGDDVICTLPISFAQAALGDELEIPTLEGKGKMRIPPGTQPATVLRVKGKGVPKRIAGGRGDQLVEVTVEVPTKLTATQKELIAKLAEDLGQSVQPQQESFMERLRNLFG